MQSLLLCHLNCVGKIHAQTLVFGSLGRILRSNGKHVYRLSIEGVIKTEIPFEMAELYQINYPECLCYLYVV